MILHLSIFISRGGIYYRSVFFFVHHKSKMLAAQVQKIAPYSSMIFDCAESGNASKMAQDMIAQSKSM